MQLPLLAIAHLCGQGQPHEDKVVVTTYDNIYGKKGALEIIIGSEPRAVGTRCQQAPTDAQTRAVCDSMIY